MCEETTLGVVLPVYQPDIPVLTQYIESLRDVLSPETVCIVVDCASDEELSTLTQYVDILDSSHHRRGKGAAIMRGFDLLETDVMLFADADGSVQAESVKDVAARVIDGSADISISSRRHPSSRIITHQTVLRRMLGDIFAFMARQMLPTRCRDYQCGAKAIRADVWDVIDEHCHKQGFAWDLEFVSIGGSLGYRIAEVPVTWRDHPESTVDPFATTLEIALALVEIRRRSKKLSARARARESKGRRQPDRKEYQSERNSE